MGEQPLFKAERMGVFPANLPHGCLTMMHDHQVGFEAFDDRFDIERFTLLAGFNALEHFPHMVATEAPTTRTRRRQAELLDIGVHRAGDVRFLIY